MTQAVRSNPFTLYMGDGGTPEVFTRVPEVGDIKSPTGERAEIDVTSHDSAAKEVLLGLRDFGECSFPVNFIPGDVTHEALYNAATSDDAITWQIKDDDSAPTMILEFDARVKGVPMDFPVDGAVQLSVTLRVTNDAVLTIPGSGS